MTTLQASYSDGLRKVKLGVVGREECQRRMEATDRCTIHSPSQMNLGMSPTGTDPVTPAAGGAVTDLAPRFRGKGFQLHASWLCIGGQEGNDTCKGDGGSPHICKTEKGWTQVIQLTPPHTCCASRHTSHARWERWPGESSAGRRCRPSTPPSPTPCAG